MLFNDGNVIVLPQDCHDAISNFISENRRKELSDVYTDDNTQEVTLKVIEVMRGFYDVFYTMSNILYCTEYESDFLFMNEIAYLNKPEVELITKIANRIFHGGVEVYEKEPENDINHPYRICKSLFHDKIFKTLVRTECMVKWTLNLYHNEILKPQNVCIYLSSDQHIRRIERILNHIYA